MTPDEMVTTDAPPSPVIGLGEGDPPPEMVERYGMEAVPDNGPGDEADGEVLDPEEAMALSEAATGEDQDPTDEERGL